MFAERGRRLQAPTPADALLNPDSTAAALTLLTPGPDAVLPLTLLDPDRLSGAGAIDALIALERHIAWLQARQHHLIAAMTHRAEARDAAAATAGHPSHDPAGAGFLREEIACALHLSPASAQQRIELARELTTRLPETLALHETGRITHLHTRILTDAVAGLDDHNATQVQDRVLPRAGEQTPGEFRCTVRRAAARLDTRTQVARHEHAHAERRVVHTPGENGMAEIWMSLAADGAATIMTALNALASTHSPDDHRTADQRRADAAVELAVTSLHDPNLPTTHGQRPTIHVTVALSTVLGHDDHPGELAGYGPIPATMARRIAADPTGTWRRLIVDEVGRLLDYGAHTYRPPADLTGHVVTRDQHCVLPGCRRNAWRCELDHRTPWPSGPTSVQNLQPLCHRHHTLKHHGGWDLTRESDGTYHWTTPTRHRHRYRPPAHPIPTTVSDTASAHGASRAYRAEPGPAPPF
jgi:hypothetical protein